MIEEVSGHEYAGSSSPTSEEPLSAEAERILAGVPDRIGDTGDQDGELEADAGAIDPEAAEIVALMDCIAFTPEDVAGAVGSLCESLDKWFDSDVWALAPEQKKLIGKPYAQLANSLWARLKIMLPGWLSSACDSTPGLMGSIMVTGVVFGPKAFQQWTLSKARARAEARPNYVASNDRREPLNTTTPPQQEQPFGGKPNGHAGSTRLRYPIGKGPRNA